MPENRQPLSVRLNGGGGLCSRLDGGAGPFPQPLLFRPKAFHGDPFGEEPDEAFETALGHGSDAGLLDDAFEGVLLWIVDLLLDDILEHALPSLGQSADHGALPDTGGPCAEALPGNLRRAGQSGGEVAREATEWDQ